MAAFSAPAFVPLASAQSLMIGSRMEVRDVVPVERTSIDAAFLRIATADGKTPLMSIDADGSVTLHHAATVGFSPVMVTGEAGGLRGYVIIRVGAEYLLMPVYTMPGGVISVAGERP